MKCTDLIFSSAESKAKNGGTGHDASSVQGIILQMRAQRGSSGGVLSPELDMSSADPPWGWIPPCFGASSASSGRFKDMNCHRAEGLSWGLPSGCPPAPGRQRAF